MKSSTGLSTIRRRNSPLEIQDLSQPRIEQCCQYERIIQGVDGVAT
jgi:hypothetical protein